MPPIPLRRLDQLLASLGYCSRREAREFLKRHEVLVDGQRVRNGALKVSAPNVRLDGEPLDHAEGLLLCMNKPAGYVCSHDAGEGPSVYDLLPARWLQRNPRPEAVGRLDKDTTGVLLFTDQHTLNHRWTSPRSRVEKVYRATVDRPLKSALIPEFASGELQLDGEGRPCRPATLELIDAHTAQLTLVEGKYHQVKRMFAHFGYTVTALHRERFGPYTTLWMPPGKWEDLQLPADGH